jgi:hypothetical protein
MKCKRVVAYNPDVSVLVELEDGRFALVSIDDEIDNALITISEFAESFLKFGGFEDGKNIPQEMKETAEKVLRKSKNIFDSKRK